MDPDLRLIQRFGSIDEGALARARQALRDLPRTRSPHRPRPAPRCLAASVASHLRADRLRVGEDLLRMLIQDQQHEDACLWRGATRFGWDEAWGRWVVDPAVPCAVPRAGEESAAIARRVLEALVALGLHGDRVELWRARLDHVGGQHEAAVTTWKRLERSSRFLGAAARIDLASAALERGELRAAASTLRGLEAAPDAVRLHGWIAAVGGRTLAPVGAEPPEAYQAGVLARPPVPAFLVALRERQPDLAPQLAGTPRRSGPHAAAASWDALVAGLPWAAFGVADGQVQLLASSAAAAGRGRLLQWAQGRGRSAQGEHDPACAVVGDHVPRVLAREGADEASAWIDSASRTAALVPLPVEAGVGWVRVEWPHAPVVCLERLAAALRSAGLQGSAGLQAAMDPSPRAPLLHEPGTGVSHAASLRTVPRASVAPPEVADPLEPIRVSLISRLPSWTVRLLDAAAEPAGPDAAQRQRVLARCSASGIVLQHRGEPERRLDASAVRGVLAPVPGRGRLVLVLESRAPGGIPAWMGPEVVRQAQLLGERLGEGEFRQVLRQRHGLEFIQPRGCPAHDQRLERAAAVIASSSPLILVGPQGAGKRLIAMRAAHAALGELPVALDEPSAGRVVLLRTPERLTPRHQVAVLERWSLAPPDNVVVCSQVPPARWPLRPELADRLRGVRVPVPSLREAPEELFRWIPATIELASQREGRESPRLTEAAQAWLWRQPWQGNLVALLEAATCLVVQGGAELGVEDLRSLLGPLGCEEHPRLRVGPSSDGALRAAAAWCRTRGGRLNRAALARWMAWDEKTVRRRAAAAGLEV